MVLGHPKVLDAAAVAMPDEILGERTCIYVVPRPGETVDSRRLCLHEGEGDRRLQDPGASGSY